MFCTSLRRRKEWAPAVPKLLQNERLKFRESKLDTHDVNLPLPSNEPGQRYLRFCLLSTADADANIRHQRVERLYHLSGGLDAAVVWLLGPADDASSFTQFQLELVDKFAIPLVPLQDIESLPVILQNLHRSFLQAEASSRLHLTHSPDVGAVRSVLPYCALSPPLREHSVNILSDLTAGFADLANKVNTDSGNAELVDYLGRQEAERVISFWKQDHLL